MISVKTVLNYFMTAVSLVTAFGVFTHDSRVDKAASTALTMSQVASIASSRSLSARYTDFVSSDSHTHPDHNSGRTLLSNFFYQSPSIAPRRKSHHKELLELAALPLRHAFDNANLPLLA